MPKNYYLFICLLLSFSLTGFAQQSDLRNQVQKVYSSQVGIRERTGNNDGQQVEAYLKYVKLTKGNPWCAAFVCWTFSQAGVENVRSGYCPNLFPAKRIVWTRSHPNKAPPLTGDVFGIYFPEKGRIAHVGFVDTWGEKVVITVEGNTNDAGSREGDGVYRKRRLTRQIYAVSRYIP
jgi:hypothetical protein